MKLFKKRSSMFTPIIILEKYPYMYSIGELHIIGSPVANCQTYSIGGASKFAYMSIEEIREVIIYVKKTIGKRQCIIDIEDYKVDSILAKLQSFIESEQHIDYVNITGSKMRLFLIRFKEII